MDHGRIALAGHMDPAKSSKKYLSATNTDASLANQLRLTQETFNRALDVLKQLGLHRRSPKFFIIYAHENDKLGIEAHKVVVTNYISWFKEILFNVDSDKSPHGYGPAHGPAHAGASLNIVRNQLCVLPRSWHNENVDHVLVFYSELLTRYMRDEADFKIGNRTYTDAVFDACSKYNHTAQHTWEETCQVVSKVQQTYSSQMGDTFHHVLTELALLKVRQSIIRPHYAIPILLFDDQKCQSEISWRPDFEGMNETQIRLTHTPGDEPQLFFKILLMFETLENDRPLIEALRTCYLKCVDILGKATLTPNEYLTQMEVEITLALRGLTNDERHRMIERPITRESLRDVLNFHSRVDYTSIKRVSGKKLPENLSDISLVVAERPNPRERKELVPPNAGAKQSKGMIVSIHGLFDEIKLADKNIRAKRFFIQGRPGVGKTTLCRRIMYEYSWDKNLRRKFDLLVRIPIQKLGQFTDLADVLFEEYFQAVVRGHELSNYLKDLMLGKEAANILIILDGLDEARQWSSEKRGLLDQLMRQPVVIITSRSYESYISPMDLYIEALGLTMMSVEKYVANPEIVPGETGKRVLGLIKGNSFIREMVQVPLHLDILCYSWDELQRQDASIMALENAGEPDVPSITALYQAVVHTLWRRDIPGLGKLDNGDKLTIEIVDAVQDASRLERAVHAESNLLEEMSINLTESGQFEFTNEDISRAIRHLELNGTRLPLSLEANLKKLSFLHSNHRGQRSKFNFIHLTFQEFFAARWLTRDERRLNQYIRQYNYSRRFERVWRFVTGLLQTENDTDKLYCFFRTIEEEPRDLLGPVHQRLIRNCLNEVVRSKDATLFTTLREELETQLSQWLIFECNQRQYSFLAGEIEFSDKVLCDALQQGSDDIKAMLFFSLKERLQIPPGVIALGTNLLVNRIPRRLKIGILEMLHRRDQALPLMTLKALAAVLNAKDSEIVLLAMEALEKQSGLPPDIRAALVATQRPPPLPPLILYGLLSLTSLDGPPDADALDMFITGAAPDIRAYSKAIRRKSRSEPSPDISTAARRPWREGKALGQHSTLPSDIPAALVATHEDDDHGVGLAAAKACSSPSTLPGESLEAIATILRVTRTY